MVVTLAHVSYKKRTHTQVMRPGNHHPHHLPLRLNQITMLCQCGKAISASILQVLNTQAPQQAAKAAATSRTFTETKRLHKAAQVDPVFNPLREYSRFHDGQSVDALGALVAKRENVVPGAARWQESMAHDGHLGDTSYTAPFSGRGGGSKKPKTSAPIITSWAGSRGGDPVPKTSAPMPSPIQTLPLHETLTEKPSKVTKRVPTILLGNEKSQEHSSA